jgi:DNA-binding CsgD family transcriptional regulator/ribosomal protein L20
MKYLILYVLIAILCSCNEPANVGNVEEQQDNYVFAYREYEEKFRGASNAQQWGLLLETASTSYINFEEYKQWLIDKIAQKAQDIEYLEDEVLYQLLYILYSKNYDEVAHQLAISAFDDNPQNNYPKSRGILAATIAHHHLKRFDIDSLKYYNSVVESYIEKDTSQLLKVIYYTDKAEISKYQGHFFESVINTNEAIEHTHKDDKHNLAVHYHNLAALYLSMDYLDKASLYNDLSLNQVGLEHYPIYMLNTLGIIQSKSQKYEQAHKTFDRTSAHAKQTKDHVLLAQTYANWGNLHRRETKYEEALHYISQSDSISRELGLDIGILINQINRAEVYLEAKMYENAASELVAARSGVEKFDIPKLSKEYYLLYYKLMDAIGQVNQANAFYRKYSEIKEQILGDLPRSIIAEWELNKEREANKHQQTKMLLDVEIEKKQKYFLSLLLLMSAFGALLFYFYRYRKSLKEKNLVEKEKIKLTHQLELKSKELLSDSLKNVSIQKIKQIIHDDLVLLISKLPQSHRNDLMSYTRKLQNKSEDIVLEEFDKRFVGVYELFYNQLLDLSPDLTQNELRVCALIRLNCSTKEIALLTNRSAGRIENIRISIRRKLKLDQEVNLQQFLIGL